MKKNTLILLLCSLSCLVFAESNDTTLLLNRMDIADQYLVKEIKAYLPDIRNVYHITEPRDTFLIWFFSFDESQYFTIIAKARHDICKYEISETDILGYTIIAKNLFIICGEELIKLKRKKNKKEKQIVLKDTFPVFDGYPPMWTFKIENKEITLVERFIPRGNHYFVKFPMSL